ncbi:unnamed protein product [Caenorhabditis auriculariae]|uniref:RRM domain-containing protein n=1 Tax=Caenorhabditis auriculariae TaxID=2777116 RepID=A0A8S1HHL7_9PELO|nr:unnamed protein product [Caenorhabditis auriculariae]
MGYDRDNYRDRDGGGYRQRFQNRINENDVPESKHTVFVRGLPGDLQLDDIRDYIEDKIGRVSFDFSKYSQDRQKLFVAVRFESRENAREFMDKYSERDFMGHNCQLQWFRDIRRYAAYQSLHGRGGFRGRGNRNDLRGDRPRRRHRSDSSGSRSRERSRSRSRSRSSRSSRSRSRSADKTLDRTRDEEDRKDVSDDEPPRDRSDGEIEPEQDDNGRRSREDKAEKKKKKKKKKRHSSSDGEIFSDDEKSKNSKTSYKEDQKYFDISLDSIPPPPVSEEPLTRPLIAAPGVSKEIKINISTSKAELKEDLDENSPAYAIQNTKYSIGLDSDTPAKVVRNKTESRPSSAGHAYLTPPPPEPPKLSDLPPPPRPPPVSIKVAARGFHPIGSEPQYEEEEVPIKRSRVTTENAKPIVTNRYEDVEMDLGTPERISPNANGVGTPKTPSGRASRYPFTQKYFGHLDKFQSEKIGKVRVERKKSADFGEGLKLSFGQDAQNDEKSKIEAREARLALLEGVEIDRFIVKKKNLEKAFCQDCETFAVVTQKLLSKDDTLESSLRIALIENLDELYAEFLKKVDKVLEDMI